MAETSKKLDKLLANTEKVERLVRVREELKRLTDYYLTNNAATRSMTPGGDTGLSDAMEAFCDIEEVNPAVVDVNEAQLLNVIVGFVRIPDLPGSLKNMACDFLKRFNHPALTAVVEGSYRSDVRRVKTLVKQSMQKLNATEDDGPNPPAPLPARPLPPILSRLAVRPKVAEVPFLGNSTYQPRPELPVRARPLLKRPRDVSSSQSPTNKSQSSQLIASMKKRVKSALKDEENLSKKQFLPESEKVVENLKAIAIKDVLKARMEGKKPPPLIVQTTSTKGTPSEDMEMNEDQENTPPPVFKLKSPTPKKEGSGKPLHKNYDFSDLNVRYEDPNRIPLRSLPPNGSFRATKLNPRYSNSDQTPSPSSFETKPVARTLFQSHSQSTPLMRSYEYQPSTGYQNQTITPKVAAPIDVTCQKPLKIKDVKTTNEARGRMKFPMTRDVERLAQRRLIMNALQRARAGKSANLFPDYELKVTWILAAQLEEEIFKLDETGVGPKYFARIAARLAILNDPSQFPLVAFFINGKITPRAMVFQAPIIPKVPFDYIGDQTRANQKYAKTTADIIAANGNVQLTRQQMVNKKAFIPMEPSEYGDVPDYTTDLDLSELQIF